MTNSDRTVKHGMGTTEAGQKLLADRWGKTGKRTEYGQVLRDQLESQLSWMDNDRSRDCLRYIRALDDRTLIRATKRGSKTVQTIAGKFEEAWGGWTNPEWITGTAAEEAYYRDLISAEEMDVITR